MTDFPEFQPWPKIPRLNRGMVITEKIDGTNACVVVTQDGRAFAQSRNHLLTPDRPDNAGFRAWVEANAEHLVEHLGAGYHYGEWWGSGIQRGYGLTGGEKRFSLFNTSRWLDGAPADIPGLGVVPVLAKGNFSTDTIAAAIQRLREDGSVAAPGFMRPEGVVVYLSAARTSFKVLVENDDLPKGLVA